MTQPVSSSAPLSTRSEITPKMSTGRIIFSAVAVILFLGSILVVGVGVGNLIGAIHSFDQVTSLIMVLAGSFTIGILVSLTHRFPIAGNAEFIKNATKGQVRGMHYFGKEMWEKHIGEVGEEPPLPLDFEDRMKKSPCPFSDNEKVSVGDTQMFLLIPKTLDGEKLTLNLLKQKVINGSKKEDLRLKEFNFHVEKALGDKPIEKSYWVLVTRDIIPGSRHKSYEEQKRMVAKKGYSVVHSVEMICGIMAEYLVSGTKLFPREDSDVTYSRCEEYVGIAPPRPMVLDSLSVNDEETIEDINNHPVFVGGFDSMGFEIALDNPDRTFGYNNFGMVACMRFGDFHVNTGSLSAS